MERLKYTQYRKKHQRMDEMTEAQIKIAQLETSIPFILEQNKRLDEKLDLILVSINKLGSEREADLYSLRFSIKKKINESIHDLKSYHDVDMKPVKEHVENTRWTEWANKYPKFTACILIAITLTIWETIWNNREIIKEIVEFFI